MSEMEICKRESFRWLNGSRFCFFLLLIFSVSYSQPDSGYSYHLSGGSEYFDLYRQRSENSRTIVFAKNSFVAFSAVSSTDSLLFSFNTTENYAAVNQQRSKFSTSLNNGRQNLDLMYSSSWTYINYALSIGTALNTSSRQLNYKISVSADPFDRILSGGISFERSPIHFTTSILFQDFFVPIQEDPLSTNISYTIQSRPFEDFSTRIDYYDSDGMNDKRESVYEVNSNHRTIGKKLYLQYILRETSIFSTEIETDEFRTELIFKKNDLSFGDLVKGFGKYSHYRVSFHTEELKLPISVKYSFDQLSLSGLGHFESWPFTTLAASIITNRLNFQLSGFIKHYSLETTADFQFEASSLSASLSYHRILPDAVLEHWEPEFLVFGEKNFTRNPFSISDIHLIGIGIHYGIPFGNVSISAYLEQYLPLSITYRGTISTASPSPSVPATTSPSQSTDGGRRAGLFFMVNF